MIGNNVKWPDQQGSGHFHRRCYWKLRLHKSGIKTAMPQLHILDLVDDIDDHICRRPGHRVKDPDYRNAGRPACHQA